MCRLLYQQDHRFEKPSGIVRTPAFPLPQRIVAAVELIATHGFLRTVPASLVYADFKQPDVRLVVVEGREEQRMVQGDEHLQDAARLACRTKTIRRLAER
mgnify:CR=1 FL=1